MVKATPGIEAWKEQTSAFDRVRSVADTVSQPRTASHIADEAHVAENTARNHLERLVDMNVLLKSDREGTTTYSPDPLHTRVQTLRDLLDEHDHDALIRLKVELQTQVETWRDEYEVGSPDELRERAAETDDASETWSVRKTANDWELVLYRLSVVEDAIANYSTYSRHYRASA